MPRSGSRSQAPSTVVEVHHRLAHTHEHGVVDRAQAAEMQRLVEDLRGGQVAPEAHRSGGAEGAGERAARLRGQAQRTPSVAVAHEHRLDRAAVGGLKQRLDRAVAGVGLVHDPQRGERHLAVKRRAHRQRHVAHLLKRTRALRGPLPDLLGSVARLRPARPAFARATRDPCSLWWQAMRLAKFLAAGGVASRRASEEIIRAGRVTVNGDDHRRSRARCRPRGRGGGRRRAGQPRARARRLRAAQARRRRLDRQRPAGPPDGRLAHPQSDPRSIPSAASTSTPPA